MLEPEWSTSFPGVSPPTWRRLYGPTLRDRKVLKCVKGWWQGTAVGCSRRCWLLELSSLTHTEITFQIPCYQVKGFSAMKLTSQAHSSILVNKFLWPESSYQVLTKFVEVLLTFWQPMQLPSSWWMSWTGKSNGLRKGITGRR